MRRVIGRSLVNSWTGRELWPGTGNVERWRRWLAPEHPIRWAWSTYRDRRARYEALFAAPDLAPVRVHRLRRPAEAKAAITRLLAASSGRPDGTARGRLTT